MDYPNCKVYNDGSHYIAIPYEPRPQRRRLHPHEELISVDSATTEPITTGLADSVPQMEVSPDMPSDSSLNRQETDALSEESSDRETVFQKPKQRQMTRKELFEELYEQTKGKRRAERKQIILAKMRRYFNSEENAKLYVDIQFDRKIRNLITRRVRLTRKINLADFNYFCTFTYDSAKHTEQSFRKKLSDCFKMMCHRKGWKYCGVWERSPEKQRLHFHGLFFIPEGTLPEELIEVKDYSPIKKCVQVTWQSTYFNTRFGRSDFKAVESREVLGEAIKYLVKYLEKTGEKIVYSKNLPQYFYSDILGEDVVCKTGIDDRKLVLFDDFRCWDYGEYMGTVSHETIAKMRKES